MPQIRQSATVWKRGEKSLTVGWFCDDENADWSSYFDLTSWFAGSWMPQEMWTINWLGLEGAKLGEVEEIWGDSFSWDFEFPAGENADWFFGMVVRELRARLYQLGEPIDTDKYDESDYGGKSLRY